MKVVPVGNPYGAAPTEYCHEVIPAAAAQVKLAVVLDVTGAAKAVG